jgi:Ca-activated chloride channel family protein
MLSEKTDGRYFNAKNTETLTQVYAEIDRLEKTETEGRLYTEYREVFQSLMLPGIACMLIQVALGATRFRGLP